MSPDDAMRCLITALMQQLPTNPAPVAFWVPTVGTRSGSVVWGDPGRRSGHRPGDDPTEWEFHEPVMGWPEFVDHVERGCTAEDINAEIQARTAKLRARFGL